MGLSIVGIAGNVTRPSRTSVLVRAVVDALAERTGGTPRQIELVEVAPVLFAALTRDRLAGEAAEIIRAVEAADVLVVGSPVYRASYTGALKHLFDLVRHDALAGRPVILAATGGSALHGLVTEHQLRPLFGFFNALTVPTTVYATEDDFRDYRITNPQIAVRIERAVGEAARLVAGEPARPVEALARPVEALERAARLPAAIAG